jgi:hypothetical protein
MSFAEPLMAAAILPAAVLETILIRLAAIFLAGAKGDMTAARHAAAQMLAAYDPQTGDEVRLAANIICFGFHALEALGQSAASDMPLTRVLRLRGSAVSLNREATKAQRRLDELQKARREAKPVQPEPQPVQREAKIEKALDLIEETRKVASAAEASGLTWTQSYSAHQRDQRIAASLKRAEARVAAQASAAAQTLPPDAAQTARA